MTPILSSTRPPDRPAAPFARALRWLLPLRFPLALAVVLLTLPALADASATRLFLGNLFVLSTPELFVVGLMAPLAAWTAVLTGRTVLAGAPARSGVPAWPWPARRPALGSAGLLAALSTPVLVAALARSSVAPNVAAARLAAHVLAIGLGATVAALAIFAGERLGGAWAADSHRGGAALPRRFLRRLGPGYDDPADARLAAAHVRTLGSAVVCGAGYAAIGLAFHPAAAPDGCLTRVRIVDGGLCFPALGYLLIVGALCAFLLAGAAFWLDRYGVPTLLAVALIALAPLPWSDADHVYRTSARSATTGIDAPAAPADVRVTGAAPPAPLTAADLRSRPAAAVPDDLMAPLTPADVVTALADRQAGRPRMVVVAASGGGSAAALWTATVLTRLEAQNGARFTRSLAALSSVSGGSFGSLVYLAPTFNGGPRPPATLSAIRAAAAQATLRPVAWGLAFPDLWRVLLSPAVGPWLRRAEDRGWAAELAWGDVWRRTLSRDDDGVTLQAWRAAVRRGAMPAPLFNAMAVETGRQMLLTPLDLAASGAGAPFDTFFGTYPGQDIRAITAARLSAAFPWISPQPRPDCDCQPAWHLADGGYFDNDGVAGLTAFLDEALPAFHAAGGRDVLVLQIRVAFDPPFVDPNTKRAVVPRRAWPFAFTGPVEALLNARGGVQSVRNVQALSQLRARWALEGVDVDVDRAVFHLAAADALPLSWQLTAAERRTVEAAWTDEAARRAAAAVAQFVGQP